MSHSISASFLRGVLLITALVLPAAARSADFPPITEAEKALREVAGQPGAPGVVIFRKAELHFRDYPKDANSRLDVSVRIKVLTEEGKNLGEVELPHSRQLRLDNFEGRIVRPNGSEQALTKDAIFVEKRSQSRKAFVTRAAFPNVEVGAIIDYKYTFYWDSFYYLEPWYFHDTLPVLLSQVLYVVPPSLGVQVWGRETSSIKMQSEKQQRRQISHLRVWMENLPGLPDEPYSFPHEDLSSRFLVIPTQLYFSGGNVPLLESWKEVSRLIWEETYKGFLAGDKQTALMAKSLVAKAGANRRDQIRALYEFVRDEVRTLEDESIWVSDKLKADEVLTKREGSGAEKSLLLYAMLGALKIPAQIVWVANRNEGRAEVDVPNPTFFDGMIIQVKDGADLLNLLPADRSLAFGHLPPYYESTRAIVVDRKKPESVVLPANPYEQNSQVAKLQLAVDAEGKVTGSGEIALAGHPAWRRLREHEKSEEATTAWLERLAEYFPGFEPSDVVLNENLRDQQMTVQFKLSQRAENVLGDEVSLLASRPFVTTQVFSLPPEQRYTPVMLGYAGIEETHLTLTWAEGFEMDALPKVLQLETSVGNYSLEVKSDPAARRAEIVRRFSRHQHEIHGTDLYATLRKLYEKASQSDAQTLVLVRN